jgi:hypothetical protein
MRNVRGGTVVRSVVVIILVAVAISVSWKAHGEPQMCQTYRIQNGMREKVGAPHPCKETKRTRTSLAWMGGDVLPQ